MRLSIPVFAVLGIGVLTAADIPSAADQIACLLYTSDAADD